MLSTQRNEKSRHSPRASSPCALSPRDNPFRADRLDALPYFFPEENPPDLWQKLEAQNFRGAIIGAHGRGKSTLLAQLQQQIANGHFPENRFSESRFSGIRWRTQFFQLNSARRNFERGIWREVLPRLSTRDFIFLDGAEQLSWWRWTMFLRFSRRAGGVLITSHQAGLLPTLYECRSSSQSLQFLIKHLAPHFADSDAAAHRLYAKHGGNLRDALRELYDWQIS